MPDQVLNAANNGDILKHPLICDVLQKCIDAGWKKITYAETHAGAGIYSSIDQPNFPNPKAHIKNLYNNYCGLFGSESLPNDPYFNTLKLFWGRPPSPIPETVCYAGSAYLAASILKERYGENFDIRLTEADEPTCNTLKTNIRNLLPNPPFINFDFTSDRNIQNGGFQNHIDWLTANDDLVLIIDPYHLSFKKSEINKGGLDIFHLMKLISAVEQKNAVIGFWYYAPKRDLECEIAFDKTIIENYGELRCRKFNNDPFHMYWIGFGKGQKILKKLTSANDLALMWFGLSKVYESLFYKRIKNELAEVKNVLGKHPSKKKVIDDVIKTLIRHIP